MRLSEQEIQERFEREIGCQKSSGIARLEAHIGERDWLTRECAIAFGQRLAADLQSPPTGEEVAKAREDLIATVGELAASGYSLGMAEGSDLPDHLEIKSLTASRDESRKECVSAIDKYGAACFAQGRAEAGKAADVLRRLDSVVPPKFVTWDVLIGHDVNGRAFFATRQIGHGEGDTFADAIAAALDQLAVETKPEDARTTRG